MARLVAMLLRKLDEGGQAAEAPEELLRSLSKHCPIVADQWGPETASVLAVK